MNAILAQLHLSQNDMIAFIDSLKDDTCTPKACQAQCMNEYIYIQYIYIYLVYIKRSFLWQVLAGHVALFVFDMFR